MVDLTILVWLIGPVLLLINTVLWAHKSSWIPGHELVYKDSSRNASIVARCPAMTAYSLPYLLASSIVHTLISSTMREHVPHLPLYTRRPVRLECGARVFVDWIGATIDPTAQTLLILHGITGHSGASYVRHLVRHAIQHGFQICVMNARGCGTTPLDTPVAFNAARTSDLRSVVRQIRDVHLAADTPLVTIAFSMGSSILINYLAQYQHDSLMTSAVAISTNFDMISAAAIFERPLSFDRHVVNRAITNRLIQWFKRHEEVFRSAAAPAIDISAVYRCRTLREWDTLINLSTGPYDSIDEYYRACSTHDKIHLVRTPLLCIQSRDDPVCKLVSVPFEAFRSNPFVMLNLVSSGGHCGWLSEAKPHAPSWLETCSVQYCQAIIHNNQTLAHQQI